MDGQNLCPANRGESHSSNPAALYVSLELKKWLITLLVPGSEKMSRHIVSGGSGDALLDLLGRLREKCERSIGSPIRVVTIMEAGRDGFWIHRLLEANQVESHVELLRWQFPAVTVGPKPMRSTGKRCCARC
jgi:hypothetical protein